MTDGRPKTPEPGIISGTPLPSEEVFSATDRFGVRVYMKAHTLEDHAYHREISDFEGHEDAVTNPAIIANDTAGEKRMYLGKPWSRSDTSLARLQRKLVTVFDARTTSARIISAHNVSETTSTRDLATPMYKDNTPAPGEED